MSVSNSSLQHQSVTIIGTGNVGSTLAYELKNIGLELTVGLYDANQELNAAQYGDLTQSLVNDVSPILYKFITKIDQVSQQDIICITAGVAQKIGQSRLDLISKNYDIVLSILLTLIPLNPRAYFIILTNPVDVILNKLYTDNRLDEHIEVLPRIFSTGTLLDTHRLFEELGITNTTFDYSSLPMMLGEHGDAQTLNNVTRRIISTNTLKIVQQSAYHTIKAKGYTNYAIASTTKMLISIFLRNQNAILPLSTYYSYTARNFAVALSLPTVIQNGKITSILAGYDTIITAKALRTSIAAITQATQNSQ